MGLLSTLKFVSLAGIDHTNEFTVDNSVPSEYKISTNSASLVGSTIRVEFTNIILYECPIDV